MKKPIILLVLLGIVATSTLVLLSFKHSPNTLLHTSSDAVAAPDEVEEKGCVFLTVFEGEGVDDAFRMPMPEAVQKSSKQGLDWLVTAQQNNGGFGAGSHAKQNIRDPHAVSTDPATTAMVAMAILRSGSSIDKGPYAVQLKNATTYLLTCVEESPANSPNITTLSGTQIQSKLGAYIDVALTSQYLSNLLDELTKQHDLYSRVFDAMEVCVNKIQNNQDSNGSTKGAGWAGVLQSSFSTNALESAQSKGAAVDTVALANARRYQQGNFNVDSGTADTESAAGVMLYSVSSSSRASAKEARKAKNLMEKAREDGVLDSDAPVTTENLTLAGMSENEALQTATAYKVYQGSKVRAQANEVISGYGNNGGEEFLSFLQTGEAMIVSEDIAWQKWYTNTSDRLLNIQNNDGSWNGHHCITSPVFCTATSLLILSVNNDLDELLAQGN